MVNMIMAQRAYEVNSKSIQSLRRNAADREPAQALIHLTSFAAMKAFRISPVPRWRSRWLPTASGQNAQDLGMASSLPVTDTAAPDRHARQAGRRPCTAAATCELGEAEIFERIAARKLTERLALEGRRA